MRFDWARNPLAQLTTSQYSLEQLITALNESIQLLNELSRAQAIGIGYGNTPRILETYLIDMEISCDGATNGGHGAVHYHINDNIHSRHTKTNFA